MSADSNDLKAQAKRSLLIGKTSGAEYIPVKVTDDGSGLGKIVVALE
jgi:hypothetical protein